MSRPIFSFPIADPPRIEIKIPSGEVRITEGTPGALDVTLNGSDRALERISVDQIADNTVRIEAEKRFGIGGGIDVIVAMPRNGEADVSVASADVLVDVPLATLRIGAASGDIRIGAVDDSAEVKTASGDVTIEEVKGDLQVSVASGDVKAALVGGDARIKSASGDITLGRVDGRLEGNSAAGDLTIRTYAGEYLRCTALSGDVTIGIPAGRTLDVNLRTMTGDVINDLAGPSGERTGRASLQVKTMAGDIRLMPAR